MNTYELLVTSVLSFSVFNGYFVYETLSILQNPITKDLNITEDAYGAIFTMSSGGSLLLTIPASILVMKLGYISLLLFNVIFTLSTILLSIILSLSISSSIRYSLLLADMVIFGCSYDYMIVAQSVLLIEEIPDNRLTVPLAISTSIARLGSFLSFLTTIPVMNTLGAGDYRYVLYYDTVICGICLTINLLYTTAITRLPLRSINIIVYTRLPLRLILLLLIYTLGYLPYYVYRTYANYIISVQRSISLEISTWYLMGVEIISLVFTPLIGWKLSDQYVWYPYILVLSILIGIVGYIVAMLPSISLLLSVLLWGFYISGVSLVIWPLISISLPVDKQIMTFTIVSIINNVYNTIFYVIGGVVVYTDIPGSLTGLTILTTGLTVTGLVMSVLYALYQR